MALVRCPEHKIPYNDENPRGCPACAREKEGGGRAALMRELARAQRSTRRSSQVEIPPPAPPKPEPPARPTHPSQRRSRSSSTSTPFVVTLPPKPPVVVEGVLRRLWRQATRRRSLVAGAVVIALLAAVLWISSGPRFVAGSHPAVVTGDARPLPVSPNTPIAIAFSALGTQPPQGNPDSPRLARYSYGRDLTIDALNSVIYAITLRIPNRTWHGLRVGMSERTARGALALLGSIEEVAPAPPAPPQIREGYTAYPSLDARPSRLLQVLVRPPNGCFDVQATIQPRTVGVLIDGEQRYAVIGRADSSPEWVVTQIRVVSRSLRGPYAPGTAC